MNATIAQISAIITAIIGLTIVSVLVSKNAQTSSVIQAGSTGLSSIIAAAVAPVSGGSTNQNNLFGSGSFY